MSGTSACNNNVADYLAIRQRRAGTTDRAKAEGKEIRAGQKERKADSADIAPTYTLSATS